MAVFTEVSVDEAGALVAPRPGRAARAARHPRRHREHQLLPHHRPGAAEYVLTLFERLTFEQLPFYLHLMKHLAQHGIPVPEPQASRQRTAQTRTAVLHKVCGKPAAVVDKLRGKSELAPDTGPLRRGGRDAGAHAPGRARLPRAASPTCAAWPGGTKPCPWCCPTWTRRRPRCSQRAGVPEPRGGRLGLRRPAARPDPCRPVPRQRACSRQRPADRLLRFLFRRRGQLAVRHRRLPERLVHRPDQRRATTRARRGLPARLWRRAAAGRRRAPPAAGHVRAGALRFWISRLWDLHLPREAAMLQAARSGPFRAGVAPAGGASAAVWPAQ